MNDTPTDRPERPASISIRVPRDLEDKIDEAAVKTRLAKQDVMRLGLERGIEVLVAQLTQPLPGVEPAAAAAAA